MSFQGLFGPFCITIDCQFWHFNKVAVYSFSMQEKSNLSSVLLARQRPVEQKKETDKKENNIMVRREHDEREREREREHERRTRKDLNTHLSLIVKTGLWTICFDVTTSLVLFYTSYCWITLIFLLWFCKTNLVSHRLSWDVQDNIAKSIFSSKVKMRCIVLALFLVSFSCTFAALARK